MAWLLHRDPARHTSDTPFWERAGEILGRYQVGKQQKPWLADLVAADRPRYEPDYASDSWQHRVCIAPMIRRSGPCGQPATDYTHTIAPATGWLDRVWFCRRHTDWGRKHELAYREARKTAPEPIPNAGGLLPSYMTLRTGDEGWVRIYEWACAWTHHRSWSPPNTYGLSADDWPTPGADKTSQRRPALRLIVSRPTLETPGNAGDDA
ncbi:hypothetical protein [Streptomyces sp. NPDC046371]|uniref:hypothetical protein n=1 Tax=Streptomyces sp. NPDC046371 TaxID=3154916 RepID=UPI0034098344